MRKTYDTFTKCLCSYEDMNNKLKESALSQKEYLQNEYVRLVISSNGMTYTPCSGGRNSASPKPD